MKKVNFDSLTNLKAPESFIENALRIPETEKKKPLPFIKYSRTLAAVACLVIVSAVCISVFLTQDRITPPITPDTSIETQADDNTENNNKDSNDNSENSQHTQDNSTTQTQSGAEVLPTGNNETIEPSEAPSPTNKPTQGESEKPSVAPSKPSETIEPSEETTVTPTQKPTSKPIVKPTIPTQKPKPTIPPTKPDDKPPESPPSRPGAPGFDDAPGSPPPPQTPSYATFSIVVDNSYLTSGERIYCNITDSKGNTVISGLYAYVYQSGGVAYAICDISSTDVSQKGNYTCNFYSQDGRYIGSNTQHI